MDSDRRLMFRMQRRPSRALWPLAAAVVVVLLAGWDVQGRYWEEGTQSLGFIKLCLAWTSWVVLPLWWLGVTLQVGVHLLRKFRGLSATKGAAHTTLVAVLLRLALWVGLSLGVWAACVEPNRLHVRTWKAPDIPQGAQPMRVVLVSDLHVGLYTRGHQLRRWVQRINELQPDAVVVAGDWTYNPHLDLASDFSPLSALKAPVFAVLGNHDVQAPGPNLAEPLRETLSRLYGVQWLEGRMLTWKGWQWIGLDDAWGGQPQPQIQRLWPASDALSGDKRQQWERRLVVAHQPDTLGDLPQNAAFLGMAGHTHGGQIWLPKLTERVLNGMSRLGWWSGRYSAHMGTIWVSSGLGTIGLPARLGVTPVLDVVELGPMR